MAGETPSHFKRGRTGCAGHLVHLPVTGAALEAMGKVTFMREIHKIRQALKTDPCDRLLTFPMIKEGLDAGFFCLDILMASHAEMKRRNAGGR